MENLTGRIKQAELVEVGLADEVHLGDVKLKVGEGMRNLDKNEPWLLNCTDERPLFKIIDPNQHLSWDILYINVVRMVGALLGLTDVILRVKPDLNKKDIVEVLKGANVIPANHIDAHAKKGELTGCGYASLRALESSQGVFEAGKIPTVTEAISEFERLGAKRVVLTGEHTGQGLLIASFSGMALHPSAKQAKNSFFSLDLGLVWEVLKQVNGELGLSEEEVRRILVGIVRDNLTTVFVLSKGEINRFFWIRSDEEARDRFLQAVVAEGLGQFKTKAGEIGKMMAERGQ